MKKRFLASLATYSAVLAAFVVFIGVGTASAFGMHQPKVPEKLLK